MATTIEKIEAMYERLERARELVAQDKINPILGMDANYIVASSTETGCYLVNGTCSCPDAQQRGLHRWLAQEAKERQEAGNHSGQPGTEGRRPRAGKFGRIGPVEAG